MDTHRKKRRPAPGLSKSELRASRADTEQRRRSQTGSLRERYPQATRLNLELRLESVAGATLDAINRTVDPDEPLLFNVPCPGGCGGGHFLLTEAVEALLQGGQETREGMAICQAASYADPRAVCGTKLYYRITIQYSPPT